MACSNILIFKHLPTAFCDKEKEDFLKYFGANEVKCISSKINKYNVAFAKFENADVAENVLHRLHQVNILGNLLSVEFAKCKNLSSSLPQQNLISSEKKEIMENEMYYKQFIDKLSSWHTEVNFKQPIPCHLKYQYPPPDMQTLVNIIKVLVTVPKFYTQVLHLMNKMNLPCPYGKDILPEVELEVYPPDTETDQIKLKKDKLIESNNIATSESEISSDEEIKVPKEIIPEQNKIKKKRKIKIAKFFKPAPLSMPKVKKTSYEEVFEKPHEEKEPKKLKLSQNIPLSESVNISTQKSDQEFEINKSGFGFIHPVKKVNENENMKDNRDDREEERLEKEEVSCISEKELFENRISEKDRAVLPVYKNYVEGAPTCRLYIKNLSKTVVQNDLKYIYNRYLVSNILDKPNMFDIRLMQEGRMKGQAFVTLQSIELAQKALKETNGYILKDKPLVVQFARSAAK